MPTSTRDHSRPAMTDSTEPMPGGIRSSYRLDRADPISTDQLMYPAGGAEAWCLTPTIGATGPVMTQQLARPLRLQECGR